MFVSSRTSIRTSGPGGRVLATLDGTLEVLQYLEKIVDGIPLRQEQHAAGMALDHDLILLEAELLRQPNCLAVAVLEDLCSFHAA